jgi:hypothetical protein
MLSLPAVVLRMAAKIRCMAEVSGGGGGGGEGKPDLSPYGLECVMS